MPATEPLFQQDAYLRTCTATVVEAGAGVAAGFPDAQFAEKGAALAGRVQVLADAAPHAVEHAGGAGEVDPRVFLLQLPQLFPGRVVGRDFRGAFRALDVEADDLAAVHLRNRALFAVAVLYFAKVGEEFRQKMSAVTEAFSL